MAEAIISRRGGGGGGLNFQVIHNPQPDTAKENTIWVDTDRINNYYFSATQPEGMVDYDVWFPVGTSSTVEFNALKKNGIQVYPLSAKQMVSGVLKDVIAKTYQNGSWIEWIAPGTIFKKGYGWVWEYGYTLPDGPCEVTPEGIYMPYSSGSKNGLKTETTVDVGSYRTLHVKLTGGGDGPNPSTNGFFFGFGNNAFDWPSNNWNSYVFINQNYEVETELTLDITGVSNLYFKMFVYTSNAVTVTDMWMT